MTTYKDAGVDIEAGNQLVEDIKPAIQSTHRPGVVSGLGGFGALFELPLDRYTNPLMVSGTDGVGTKLRIAIQTGDVSGVGIDLVAMCANDIVVLGAEPLFFLDYYATGKLDTDVAKRVICSIADGCRQAGAALIGGETAEMPSMYHDGDFDLAGFCVGIVERDSVITGQRVEVGDILIALQSSGIHSNGFSLVRKILSEMDLTDGPTLEQYTRMLEDILTPTKIYVNAIRSLLPIVDVRSICHVTGGGLTENLPRVLPDDTVATVDVDSWHWPGIFKDLQNEGKVATDEMYRTFNCGVGMVVCVPKHQAVDAVNRLRRMFEEAWVFGRVSAGKGPATVKYTSLES